MKITVFLLANLLLAGTLFTTNRPATQQDESTRCQLLVQAIDDYNQLKSAKTRGEIEKYFTADGGAQFPPTTRYNWLKCQFIHVAVEFELKSPSTTPAGNPEDKVKSLSHLYVDYPARD